MPQIGRTTLNTIEQQFGAENVKTALQPSVNGYRPYAPPAAATQPAVQQQAFTDPVIEAARAERAEQARQAMYYRQWIAELRQGPDRLTDAQVRQQYPQVAQYLTPTTSTVPAAAATVPPATSDPVEVARRDEMLKLMQKTTDPNRSARDWSDWWSGRTKLMEDAVYQNTMSGDARLSPEQLAAQMATKYKADLDARDGKSKGVGLLGSVARGAGLGAAVGTMGAPIGLGRMGRFGTVGAGLGLVAGGINAFRNSSQGFKSGSIGVPTLLAIDSQFPRKQADAVENLTTGAVLGGGVGAGISAGKHLAMHADKKRRAGQLGDVLHLLWDNATKGKFREPTIQDMLLHIAKKGLRKGGIPGAVVGLGTAGALTTMGALHRFFNPQKETGIAK